MQVDGVKLMDASGMAEAPASTGPLPREHMGAPLLTKKKKITANIPKVRYTQSQRVRQVKRHCMDMNLLFRNKSETCRATHVFWVILHEDIDSDGQLTLWLWLWMTMTMDDYDVIHFNLRKSGQGEVKYVQILTSTFLHKNTHFWLGFSSIPNILFLFLCDV